MSNPIGLLNNLTPQNPVPENYTTPPFPSLYWPLPLVNGYSLQASYLYRTTDIWRFTVVWTLVFYGACHVVSSAIAVVNLGRRNWKIYAWAVPVVYAVLSGLEAFLAGSVVGGLLGGVYNAGFYRMSTWIPFVWGLINTVVLVLSSFAIQSGL